MTGEDRTTPRCDGDFIVNVNGRTFTHKFPEGFAEPPVTDPTRQAHAVYPGGPPCAESCPGEWSTYHDGYEWGYESALSTTPAPDEPEWPALANDIRAVDGNHDLGAGALAEALIARGWTRRRHP